MMRGWVFLLVLLSVGCSGCFKRQDPNSGSIPKIPPGRSKPVQGQGEKFPIPPPAQK
jgi:hypothetical protein